VSGAVKQLTSSGLLERVPAPGSRRDHYRFPEGVWARLMLQQNQLLATMGEVAEQGLAAAGDPAPRPGGGWRRWGTSTRSCCANCPR